MDRKNEHLLWTETEIDKVKTARFGEEERPFCGKSCCCKRAHHGFTTKVHSVCCHQTVRMSARMKKSTTTTTTTHESGGSAVSSPSLSGSRPGTPRRPGSPTMISRIQEKQELAGLNDRLASYIDRVRYLENENSKLTKRIQTHDETIHREVTNIKGLYENELSDARKSLDNLAKEKAKLQVDIGTLRTDYEDLKDKYSKRDREFQNLQKKLLAAEAQVNDLQARLNDAVSQRRHWEDEFSHLSKEHDGLVKQLSTAKKQLEEETVSRVDLENRVQSLKEELDFRGQVHDQELSETMQRTRVEIEEVDGKLQQEYESKLGDALQDMREHNDTMIRTTREDTEELFLSKLGDLRSLMDQKDGSAAKAKEECRYYRKQVDEMSSELIKLRTQNAALEARVKDLEVQLRKEQDEHNASIDHRDSEIRRLRDALEAQLSEYRDLLDIKIQLDTEITAYRKLLETEETRLNLSTGSESTPGRSRTPSRATPMSSRKRKRTTVEETLEGTSSSMKQLRQAASSAGFSASSSAKGIVEINETDPEGHFIKLHNSSEKDQTLGGWLLKHTAGNQETIFKFHRSSQLKAGQFVTVWSSETDQTHSPPTDLVMKGQKWFTADNMKTVLSNPKGDEMASREMARSSMRTSYMHTSGGLDENDSGSEENGNRSWFWWK